MVSFDAEKTEHDNQKEYTYDLRERAALKGIDWWEMGDGSSHPIQYSYGA